MIVAGGILQIAQSPRQYLPARQTSEPRDPPRTRLEASSPSAVTQNFFDQYLRQSGEVPW